LNGKEPEKMYKGSFNIRIKPELQEDMGTVLLSVLSAYQSAAKGLPASGGLFFVHSRHVESIVLI